MSLPVMSTTRKYFREKGFPLKIRK
jgi:hypothetical protein